MPKPWTLHCVALKFCGLGDPWCRAEGMKVCLDSEFRVWGFRAWGLRFYGFMFAYQNACASAKLFSGGFSGQHRGIPGGLRI